MILIYNYLWYSYNIYLHTYQISVITSWKKCARLRQYLSNFIL